MTVVAVLLVAATAAYAGFQATIRVLVYPQFAGVASTEWVAYEQAHQRRVSLVVGPLFVLDGIACLTAFAVGPRLPAVLAGAALAAVLLLTAGAAVPCHRSLSDGFDAAVLARLLRVDTARVVAALVGVAGAVWYALTV